MPDDLFGALFGAPALPGAKCRGRPHLFDEPAEYEPHAIVAQRHTQALALCVRCPSLDPCRAWFDRLKPRERPRGVIAGIVIASPTSRRKEPNESC